MEVLFPPIWGYLSIFVRPSIFGHFIGNGFITFIDALVQLVNAIIDKAELHLLIFIHALDLGEYLVEDDVHVHVHRWRCSLW